jgi:hypothetical protein
LFYSLFEILISNTVTPELIIDDNCKKMYEIFSLNYAILFF